MMPNFLRPQTYPYAGSSTGPYRGLLVRKYPCWEAQGPAREIFTSDIARRIKAVLEQCLPESNSFIGFSLFMVGKLPEKTKPTIMIVSDDKPRRKAAFQVIKSKNILTTYPGFELGHCSVAAEFEDLKQLGSDTLLPTPIDSYEKVRYLDDEFEPGTEVRGLLSTEVCALEYPSWREPTRLCFQTSLNSHSHTAAVATCGGLLQIENGLYALTMAHSIYPIRRMITNPEPQDDSSSQSDDFEITGMDESDDEEEYTKTLIAITSPGSKTSLENSDSEESLLISSKTDIGTGSSMVHEEDYIMENYEESEGDEEEDIFAMCEPVGSIVSVDEALDIAVIKITPNELMTDVSSIGQTDTRLLVDSDPADTTIIIKTTHHPEIRGERSMMPFYTRLPGKSNFLELYSVQLSIPVRHGDSGSWAFDGKGKLVGFVLAGNPKTGSCLLLPARPALLSVRSLLRSRESSAKTGSVNWPGQPMVGLLSSLPDKWESDYDGSRQIFRYKPTGVVQYHFPQPGDEFLEFFDTPDEDAMTVGSSLPPPSLFSHRMDHGTTPSSAGYEYISGTSLTRESLSRGDAGLGGSFVNKEKFFEGQAAEEFERLFGIIQGKDKRPTVLPLDYLNDYNAMPPSAPAPVPMPAQAYEPYPTAVVAPPAPPMPHQPSSEASADDWDASKMERLGMEYMAIRKEMWQGLAARTGEKWNVVEQKCMHNGLKNLQSAARSAARRKRLEQGYSIHVYNDDSGVSGVGLTPVDDLDMSYSIPETSSSVHSQHSQHSGNDGYSMHPVSGPTPYKTPEQSHHWPAPTFTNSTEASPEMPNLPTYQSQSPGIERETNRDVIEETRTGRLTQIDANEALSRENRGLKRGIEQAIEAISKVHDSQKEGDYEGLLNIASDLGQVLHKSKRSRKN